MSAPILPFVLALMTAAAPERDHTELGTAIAAGLETSAPFFTDDTSKEKSAALAVAVAFRESSLTNDILGDKGQSACAFQVHLPGKSRTSDGWTKDDLRADATKCVTVAFRMLRQSIRVDPKHPVAHYARGPRWKTIEAQRLSNDRVWLARRLHAAATAALAAESSS